MDLIELYRCIFLAGLNIDIYVVLLRGGILIPPIPIALWFSRTSSQKMRRNRKPVGRSNSMPISAHSNYKMRENRRSLGRSGRLIPEACLSGSFAHHHPEDVQESERGLTDRLPNSAHFWC